MFIGGTQTQVLAGIKTIAAGTKPKPSSYLNILTHVVYIDNIEL